MSGVAEIVHRVERAGVATTAPRLHALDNLRALAMLLGVTLHAVLPFVTEPGADIWPVRSADRGEGFDLIAGLIHAWRMQLFFILAGFFGRLVHQRLGWRGFLKQRGLRIGLPFVAGMGLIAPIVWWQFKFGEGPGATVHLWFLQYLIIYSAAAVVVAGMGGTPGVIDGAARFLFRSRWKALWCAIPTAWLMIWSPIWDETGNARGATFAPNALALVYYGIFFAFGWVLHRHADLLRAFEERVALHLVLGFATLIGWGILYRAQQGGAFAYPAAAWPAFLLAGAANAWCFCFGLMGLFLGKLNVESKPARYLADASYWIYLAHLPLVIALQQWLLPMGMGPWTKFALINAISFAVLIASYEWLVRYTVVGKVLNGPRRRVE